MCSASVFISAIGSRESKPRPFRFFFGVRIKMEVLLLFHYKTRQFPNTSELEIDVNLPFVVV